MIGGRRKSRKKNFEGPSPGKKGFREEKKFVSDIFSAPQIINGRKGINAWWNTCPDCNVYMYRKTSTPGLSQLLCFSSQNQLGLCSAHMLTRQMGKKQQWITLKLVKALGHLQPPPAYFSQQFTFMSTFDLFYFVESGIFTSFTL